jgi:hypothetical protein
LLAAGSAAYEFHLAAKRSHFHVTGDRWCARAGHRASEAGVTPGHWRLQSLSAIGLCWGRAGAIPSQASLAAGRPRNHVNDAGIVLVNGRGAWR